LGYILIQWFSWQLDMGAIWCRPSVFCYPSPSCNFAPIRLCVGASYRITPQVSDLFTDATAFRSISAPRVAWEFLFAHLRFPHPPALWIEAQDPAGLWILRNSGFYIVNSQ
jgi:hypothetical protein